MTGYTLTVHLWVRPISSPTPDVSTVARHVEHELDRVIKWAGAYVALIDSVEVIGPVVMKP